MTQAMRNPPEETNAGTSPTRTERAITWTTTKVVLAVTRLVEWATVVIGLRLSLDEPWSYVALGAIILAVNWDHVRTARRIRKRYRSIVNKNRKDDARGAKPAKFHPIAAVQAVRPEVALTPFQRDVKWWNRLCEVRHIAPVPELVESQRTDEGRKLTLRLDAAGMTVETFQRLENQIAHYIGRGVIDVRIVPHPGHKGMCFVYIVTKDTLAKDIGPPPDANDPIGSRSIMDGFVIAKSYGGEDVTVDVFNDWVFLGGMRRSGKSTLLHRFAMCAFKCGDVEVWPMDMKGGAEFFHYKDKVAHYATTPSGVETELRFLLQERQRREQALQRMGLRKWRPDCGFPFIYLIVDEVAEVSKPNGAGQQMLTDLARLGGAQGIGGILATQRPEAKLISTTLRSQCNVGISFQVRDTTDVGITLGPGAVNMGLHAHRLPRHQFYILGSDEIDGRRCRGWNISDELVEATAAQLPTIASRVSDQVCESDSDRTEKPLHLESAPRLAGQVSDSGPSVGEGTPEPPDDCLRNAKRMRLWNAMPGTAKRLQDASGYGSSQCHNILTGWEAQGLVTNYGTVWRHRSQGQLADVVYLVDREETTPGAASDGL